jgi:hypothetical protein
MLATGGRPLFYWGARPPVVVPDALVRGGAEAQVTEVHAARDAGDLVLRFTFDRPVGEALALADGTPVSGRLRAVLYVDGDDDRRTGLAADPPDPRQGADARLELGVLYVGEDPEEDREASAVISVVLSSLSASGRRRTSWRGDDVSRPDNVSARGEWVEVRVPAGRLVTDSRSRTRLILTVGSRSWDGYVEP